MCLSAVVAVDVISLFGIVCPALLSMCFLCCFLCLYKSKLEYFIKVVGRMCGIDFSSSIWFRFGFEKNCGFGFGSFLKNRRFGGQEQRRSMNIIRSIHHDIYSETINKIALSASNDKSVISEDNIHMLAYGHWRLRESSSSLKTSD